MGLYVRRQFDAKHGADNVEAERPIAWGNGWTGHADLYVRPEKLLIEVVSTVGGNIDHKIRQVKLYLLHDTEAENAAVYVVNPSSLDREELFPVFVTDDDLDELHGLVDLMQHAAETGELPPCVHTSPTGCKFSGCPFTAAAFEGWEPPDPVDVSGTPAFRSLAAEFYQRRRAREGAKALLEAADAEYAETKAALAELMTPDLPYTAGPLELKRTMVRGRETFSYARAKQAGVITPALEEALQPFVKVSDGYSTISIRRVSDEPVLSPDEFGDEAPF